MSFNKSTSMSQTAAAPSRPNTSAGPFHCLYLYHVYSIPRLFHIVLVFAEFWIFFVCAFIKASLAESNVAMCNAKSAEVVTFSNAGKMSLIMLSRLFFFQI